MKKSHLFAIQFHNFCVAHSIEASDLSKLISASEAVGRLELAQATYGGSSVTERRLSKEKATVRRIAAEAGFIVDFSNPFPVLKKVGPTGDTTYNIPTP